MPLFDRCYRLVVGPAGGTGREIASGPHGETSLRITFDIEKTTKEKTNHSKVVVYNLAPETRALFEQPDQRLTLHAGYLEDRGPLLIATGHVTFAFTTRDEANWATTLELHDGHVPLRDTAVSIGMGAGASAKQIVRDIARQMAMSLVMPDDLQDRTWKHGFSYFGAGRVGMHKVVDAAGWEWSVQNETVQVLARGGTSPREAIVISPSSGMVKSPERKREGAQEIAQVADLTTGALPRVKKVAGLKPELDGWQVTSFLQPTINPGDMVKVESVAIKGDGFFRVDHLRHLGDSAGGDWHTELDLIDPKDYAKRVAAQAAKAAKAKAHTAAGQGAGFG
jgi:hypothetical protein